ncbi:UNVERIFIED_CONTAM: hypothetical protein C3P01_19225, partial [Clostridioides difficile]
LDTDIGKIRGMASEGMLTADIVKNSLLAASAETNAQFEKMPYTLGQIFTSIKNNAVIIFGAIQKKIEDTVSSRGFRTFITDVTDSLYVLGAVGYSVFNGIIDLLSSPTFQGFFNMLIVGASLVAQGLGWIITQALSVANVFAQNWSIISPIVYGVISAIAIYKGVLLASTIATMAASFVNSLYAVAAYKACAALAAQEFAIFGKISAQTMEALVTAQATAAQWGFNAALYACPLTWVVLGIIAVIAAIFVAVAIFNHFAGTSVSAIGIVAGAISVAAAFIGNLFIATGNLIIDIVALIYNSLANFAEFFANFLDDPIGSVIRAVSRMADAVLGILRSIASAIDTIFGSNLANAVSGWQDKLQGWTDKVAGEAKIKVERMDPNKLHFDRFNYGKAWDAGYKWGDKLETNIKDKFDISKIAEKAKKDLGLDDLWDKKYGLGDGFGSAGLNSPLNDAAKGAKDTAGNTAKMAKTMDKSQEDLKYLRDIAEQEVINRFTGVNIKIDMNNTNNISRDTDLDGIVNVLTEKLNDAMVVSAEGIV